MLYGRGFIKKDGVEDFFSLLEWKRIVKIQCDEEAFGGKDSGCTTNGDNTLAIQRTGIRSINACFEQQVVLT